MYTVEAAKLKAKGWCRKIRAWLGISPMQKVLKFISQTMWLHEASVLECFGCDGQMHTVEYASQVKKLEIWEWATDKVAKLRNTFPSAKVVQTDSFESIKTTLEKYDIVIIDASPKSVDHYDVFSMFPHALELANTMSPTFFVCTTARTVTKELFHAYPELKTEEFRITRAKFYEVPLNFSNEISKETVLRKYRKLAAAKGKRIDRFTFVRRNKYLEYFVFEVVPNLP